MAIGVERRRQVIKFVETESKEINSIKIADKGVIYNDMYLYGDKLITAVKELVPAEDLAVLLKYNLKYGDIWQAIKNTLPTRPAAPDLSAVYAQARDAAVLADSEEDIAKVVKLLAEAREKRIAWAEGK